MRLYYAINLHHDGRAAVGYSDSIVDGPKRVELIDIDKRIAEHVAKLLQDAYDAGYQQGADDIKTGRLII